MKKHLLKKLLLFFFPIFVLGCNKSSTVNPEYVGLYQQSNITALSAITMYTKDGIVYDTNTIKLYLSRYKFDIYFNLNTQTESNSNGFEANFENERIVKWSYLKNSGIFSAEYNITDKTSSGFVLRAVDSTRTTHPNITNKSQLLSENSNIISKLNNCNSIDVGTGYVSTCTYREALPFIIYNNNLYLSSISCATSTYITNPNSYGNPYITLSTAAYKSVGVFNPEVVKQLSAGDTLVVQTGMLQFIKK